MSGRCVKHSFEPAADSCRHCGHEFCDECLVYSFGRSEPPFCVACALAAAGVRSNAARRPALSRREIRRQAKLRRKAERQRAAEQVPSPAETGFDWSAPQPAPPGTDPDWLAEQFSRPHGERVPF
jgi:hypothetical protein